MKEKILGIFVCMLMIGSIFGSMNTVKSEPPDNTGWTVIERGANFVRSQNITNPDIFSWESAHQWVYDGTSWVPYIFDETADYYQVQSGLIGTRIYKDGYAEFWDPDMTEVRLYEEMWILEYYDNDKWKVCDVYSPTFVVDSDDTSINITASFITDYPNSGERAFDVKYIFREGRPLKHEIIFTSHSTEEHLFRVKQKWAGIVSTKVMHDSGIDAVTELMTIDSSKFKFLKADGSLSVYENQWEMYYGYDKATHRRYILENHNLKPVEIDVHAQGLKADFVFGNWILSQDENLAIDPDTATLDNPTEDGFIIRNDEGYFRANEEYEILFGGYGGFGEWGEDFRGYVEWDVSSLAGVTLTANPVFKYEGLEDWATDEEINPITEEQPSDGGCTDAELYGYITSGTAYVEPFNFQVGENKSVDLGAYAKSDLQIAILSQSWFAIGFQSPADEGELNDDLVSIIFAEEADDPYPIPPPTLYVEYTPEPTVTLGTAIYYFDDYPEQGEQWYEAENMVDGNEETYAIEWEHESVQFLCHNSGELVEELEGILKVEIRAKTYYNAYYGEYEEYGGTVILRPVFGEHEDGDNHDCLSPEGTGAWSEWFDITHDTNAPEEWMFVNIWVLQCDVEQSSQWNPQVDVFCSKVEIRVYYITPLLHYEIVTNVSQISENIGSVRRTAEVSLPFGVDIEANEVFLSSQAGDDEKEYVVTSPDAGQEVYIHWVFTIWGSGSVDDFYIRMWLRTQSGGYDIFDTDILIEDTSGGYIYTYWFTNPWVAPGGTYKLSEDVDSQEDIIETDEGNNYEEISFTVTPTNKNFDLKAEDLWLSSESYDWDKQHELSSPLDDGTEIFFYFHWIIFGVPETVTDPYYFKITLTGPDGFVFEELIEEEQYRKAGYNIKVFLHDDQGNGWFSVVGDYTLTCTVDNQNDVTEWNENNNELSYQFNVISGTELWFYPPYYDDDTHIQSQGEFYVNSQILKNLMMSYNLGLNFTSQSPSSPEEPMNPLGFPYAEADADKDTGEVYVRAECYTNPVGEQPALAEAIIIGPEEQTFKVSENGNYLITFYTSLTDGIVWIYCDLSNVDGKAAGAATIEGQLYEEGNEDPINYDGKIIYDHIDLGYNEFHVNFDPETYEFSFNQYLTADTDYYFKFFLSMFSYTKSYTGEAKAWGQLEMCLDSVSVIKQ